MSSCSKISLSSMKKNISQRFFLLYFPKNVLHFFISVSLDILRSTLLVFNSVFIRFFFLNDCPFFNFFCCFYLCLFIYFFINFIITLAFWGRIENYFSTVNFNITFLFNQNMIIIIITLIIRKIAFCWLLRHFFFEMLNFQVHVTKEKIGLEKLLKILLLLLLLLLFSKKKSLSFGASGILAKSFALLKN